MAMGELGCHNATIPEDIIQELFILDVQANPPPGDFVTKHPGTPSTRLLHLAQASIDIDYLADNGAALTDAIAGDSVAVEGLHEALQAFTANETQSRRAIEEVMAQV